MKQTPLALGELPRLQVPRQYLNQYIGLIKNWVSLIPVELIYNLGETGLSGWEDSKPKPVLVSTTLGDAMIHYPVNRQIRHQTLLSCSSASGGAYCPSLVSAKQSGLRFSEIGVRGEMDLCIKPGRKPFSDL
jgi:hypothetical protein